MTEITNFNKKVKFQYFVYCMILAAVLTGQTKIFLCQSDRSALREKTNDRGRSRNKTTLTLNSAMSLWWSQTLLALSTQIDIKSERKLPFLLSGNKIFGANFRRKPNVGSQNSTWDHQPQIIPFRLSDYDLAECEYDCLHCGWRNPEEEHGTTFSHPAAWE